eukprot:779529-Amphidinium_carterae.1
MRVAVFIDGSPSTASDLHPQSGHIRAITDDGLDSGQTVNMIAWRSGKIEDDQLVLFTLLVERETDDVASGCPERFEGHGHDA